MTSTEDEVEAAQHRRKSDVAFVSLCVTIVVTLGGFVWQAAKLDSTVEQLERVTLRLEQSEERRALEAAQWAQRLGVVETRQVDLIRRVDRLEDYHR